jgi:hypothetical protein
VIRSFDLSGKDKVSVEYFQLKLENGSLDWENVRQEVKDEMPMTIAYKIKRRDIKQTMIADLIS